MAAAVVYMAFDARLILSTPVWGGCGMDREFAYIKREWSRLALFAIPLLWCGARRSPWAVRVARTSFVVAVLWWLYCYPTHGHRAWLGA